MVSCDGDYNRGKNGREKEKRKTKNDVTGLDAERGLQQVEGESWGSWGMAPLDVRTCLGRQRTKKKSPILPNLKTFFSQCTDHQLMVTSSDVGAKTNVRCSIKMRLMSHFSENEILQPEPYFRA